jgi:hypothetical protein
LLALLLDQIIGQLPIVRVLAPQVVDDFVDFCVSYALSFWAETEWSTKGC